MVTPSDEDRKEVLNEVTEYATQLGTAADMNTFIRSTGSVVPFSEIAINKTVYPNDVVARLDSVTINEVYGPYYNHIMLLKLLPNRQLPTQSNIVKFRYMPKMLLKPQL